MTRARLVVSLYTFELAYALMWFITGINWLYAADDLLLHSAVQHIISHAWVYTWGVLYVLGGPLGVYGLLTRDARFRVAGLSLLVAAILMNGLAAATASLELRDANFLVLAGAGIARIADIVRESKLREAH